MVEVVVGAVAAAAVTVAPRPLVIFHLQMAIVVITATSIRKRMIERERPRDDVDGLAAVDGGREEPQQRQPDEHVEDVRPHGGRHGHVALALAGDEHRREQVGDEVPAARKVRPITTVGM